ncbi:MAG: hypothetical protein JW744_00560 [Candidatus Diapherotrites archaeon]|uniref:Uncharacterized protein n=1 Tax=Candidatus Iainarchaeum sp. TaxID=3101447 RepID=A0A938YRX5_9ARCH|nr:hypothetical protein [Candidatus Diapherotrites archaeon]
MARLPKKRNAGKNVQRVVVRRVKPQVPPGLKKKLKRAYGKEKPRPGQILDGHA